MTRRRKTKEKLEKLLKDDKEIEFSKAEFSAKQWVEEKKAEKHKENDDD